MCVILSVYVLAPIMEHSRRTETVRERGRGRKKKKRIVRREKKNPRLLKCKLIVRVHHKSPMIKVIATNAARATSPAPAILDKIQDFFCKLGMKPHM